MTSHTGKYNILMKIDCHTSLPPPPPPPPHTHTHTHTSCPVYHYSCGSRGPPFGGTSSVAAFTVKPLLVLSPPALLNHFLQVRHRREPCCSWTGLLRSSRHFTHTHTHTHTHTKSSTLPTHTSIVATWC